MEDSVKGVIITFAIISMFVTGLINFILLFPVEQGFSFTTIDNNTYLVINNLTNPDLTNIEGSLDTGFEEWDIEVGFMGSNTQKASKSTTTSYVTQVTDTLKIIIHEVFTTSNGSVHPMVYIFGVFLSLITIYITFVFIKFIRTGY